MAAPDRAVVPPILLVLLALLGFTSLQSISNSGQDNDGGAGQASDNKAKGSSAFVLTREEHQGAEDRESEILGPLLDHFAMLTEERGLDQAYARTERLPRALQCLIATVPDPVQSTTSHRFDEILSAIQRACESERLVLDRYRIPWAPLPGLSPAPSASSSDPIPGVRPKPTPPRQPGLLLFRSTLTAGSYAPLLAVFLVPETPTLGIDKKLLLESLRLAEKWSSLNRECPDYAQFHILGPTFSGSQHSLEEVLHTWTERAYRITDVSIISGAATAIEQNALTNCVSAPHTVTFAATVHTGRALRAAVLDVVGQQDDVALLTEGNTAAGLALSIDGTERAHSFRLIEYPFPLHVSKIRGYYAKKGLLRDGDGQALGTAEQVSLPFEEAGDVVDIPPLQTPGFTTAVDELLLNQILTDIARRNIRKVGIIATDPLDVVFLARQVRRFCPDVLLFTTQGHAIYTHPQNVAELRGMLVASTYPLYSPNQLWSYSHQGGKTRFFFAGDAVQGTYNATVAHLEILGDPNVPPHFLEYGTPFDPPANEEHQPNGPPTLRSTPPIWISVVGNHGLFPVTMDRSDRPHARWLKDRGSIDISYVYSFHPKQPHYPVRQVIEWFRPMLSWFWLYLVFFETLMIAVLAGVAFWVYRWAAAEKWICPPLLSRSTAAERLAYFLNCRRTEDSAKEGRCRGPGLYLAAAILVTLVAYMALTIPLFEVIARIPWTPLYWGYLECWISLIAYGCVCLALVSLALACLAWARMSLQGLRAGTPHNLAPVSLVRADATEAQPAVPAHQPVSLASIRWHRGRVTLLILLIIVAFSIPAFRIWQAQSHLRTNSLFVPLEKPERDALFRLSRTMAVPSGVSPVLASVMLGFGALAWVYSQLRRRFVFEQFMPPCPFSETKSGESEAQQGDQTTLRMIREQGESLEESLRSPLRTIAQFHGLSLLAVAICTFFFLWPVLEKSFSWRGKSLEGKVFDAVVGASFSLLFILLAFHTLQVILLWLRARGIMRLMVRLPLTTALDRVPSRVSRWLKESPRSGGGRFDLIQRQALALAVLGESDAYAARHQLGQALGHEISPEMWELLTHDLKNLSRRSVGKVKDRILGYLVEYWRPLALNVAFPDSGGENQANTPSSSSGASSPVSQRLTEWVRCAEDLMALLFLRWLAASLSQVWILIRFLVVGCVALLLATNSYPFLFQDRLMLGLGALILVLVATILAIVLGFNRDELISRLSNTAPNQFKLDQHLIGGFLTYVVPLLGVLGAMSFDTSDTLRSLLDPVLRHVR